MRSVVVLFAVLMIASCSTAPTGPPPPRTPVDLAKGLLTDGEAGGERQPEEPDPFLAACGADAPVARAAALWVLPDGSRLVHAVEAHPRPADLVMRLRDDGTRCFTGGPPALLGPVLGVHGEDVQHAWCVKGGPRVRCGAVLAKGDLLAAVEVTGEDHDAAGRKVADLIPALMAGIRYVGFRPTTAAAPTTTTTVT